MLAPRLETFSRELRVTGTVFLMLNGMFVFLSGELERFIPSYSAKLIGERDRESGRLLHFSVVGLAHHACRKERHHQRLSILHGAMSCVQPAIRTDNFVG